VSELLRNAINSLVRRRIPSLKHEVVDYDDLVDVLLKIEAEIGVDGDNSGGIGLDVTRPPYNMDNSGGTDCSALLSSILAEGNRLLWFPPGTYRFDTPVSIPTGTVLLGAGPNHVTIKANGSRWLDGQYTVGGDGKPNWARIKISGFRIDMAQGGIRLGGHENRITDMRFRGGAAGHWCIEMYAANECAIAYVSGGYGPNTDNLSANGIRWYATNDENTINYGDSLILEVAFKGDVDNWVGLALEHLGTHATRGVINNILVARAQFQAPGSGSDPLSNPNDPASVRVKNNSVGVRLKHVQRCTFVTVDVEATFYGFKSESQAGGLGGKADKRNAFIGCQGFNTRHGWHDQNDSYDGSAGQNVFVGCQEVGPLLPVGLANGDPDGTYNGRRATHDILIGGALWFARPGNGAFKTAIRCTDGEHLYVVHDYQEPSRNGTTKYPYDGMPKYRFPRKALGIDVASSLNAARLFRPQGFVAQNSLSNTYDDNTAPGAPAKESRIIIGNGQGFTLEGQPVNPLHRVEIADPLYVAEWTNPLVTSYGANAPGIVANARQEDVLGTVRWWTGPGLYTNRRVPGGQFEWRPLASIAGATASQLGRSGTSYTMDRNWFGMHIEHTAAATITIPTGLIGDDEALSTSGLTAARWFVIRSGQDDVTLSAGSGVSLYPAGRTTSVSSYVIPGGGYAAFIVYTRTGSSSARVDIYPLGMPVKTRWISNPSGGTITRAMRCIASNGGVIEEIGIDLRNDDAPEDPITYTIEGTGLQVGDRWRLRVARDQNGAVTLQGPSGSLFNGRSSLRLLRGGIITVQCFDATSGAAQFHVVGPWRGPDITTSSNLSLFDRFGIRHVTATGLTVTVPNEWTGTVELVAEQAFTLAINGNNHNIAQHARVRVVGEYGVRRAFVSTSLG